MSAPDSKRVRSSPVRRALYRVSRIRRRAAFSAHVAIHFLAYGFALRAKAPLERQATLLPARLWPDVYWVRLRDITHRARYSVWAESPDPIWRFARTIDTANLVVRPSAFSRMDDDDLWSTHNTIYDLFVDNREPRETGQYARMIDGVHSGSLDRSRGCRTSGDVEAYFRRLGESFESMCRSGYLTQAELGGKPHDEIPIYLTADARLVKLGGANHRILMAEILGIEWVPVIFRGADPQWLLSSCRELNVAPHQALDGWIDRVGIVRRHLPKTETRPLKAAIA